MVDACIGNENPQSNRVTSAKLPNKRVVVTCCSRKCFITRMKHVREPLVPMIDIGMSEMPIARVFAKDGPPAEALRDEFRPSFGKDSFMIRNFCTSSCRVV